MTPSIRLRLFLVQALVLLAALAVVTLLAFRQQRAWALRESEETLQHAALPAAARLPAVADWDSLADRLGDELAFRVTLMDRAGRVLGDSQVERDRIAEVENHAHRPEMAAALAGRVGQAVRRSATLGLDLVYVAVPAPAGREVAVLRLAEPLTVAAAMAAALLRLSLWVALAALLLTLPLLLWAVGRHSGRIAELESVARRLAAGDPAARAREIPADELGRLGHAVNHMAEQGRARLDALERERDEREAILAHMSDGVALVDDHARVARMNRGFAELLGMPMPAAPGTALREFARVPELDELIATARREDRPVEADLRLWAAAQRPVHATATPLPAGGGRSVLVVLHDLSESERLDRVRQDFVANVSHELRTPLTSLRGYAETLLDGGLEDAERREGFVRVIRDQAVRLEALAEDLLVLATLERPGATLHREPLNLRELVERQAAGFRARARQAGLTLDVAPGPPVPVIGDRVRLEQVVANLLDNAVKYTERGGVTVRLGEAEGSAWCEVSDTGSGIPAEERSRVFERFYRVDKARSREKGGTGLGLSIVKHIIGLHDGEVSVQSRVGEGSTFRFEIPRAPADA